MHQDICVIHHNQENTDFSPILVILLYLGLDFKIVKRINPIVEMK